MFNISKQQVLDAFNFRSACRKYDTSKKISKEDMDYIFRARQTFTKFCWF